jgi:hypothetical protein
MPKSRQQSIIDKHFPTTRAIAYQPGLSIVFGSVTTGVFLSQLLYWQGKGSNKEGWIYKTIPDLQRETGLTRSNQETAIKQCVELGFLETKLTGRVPRTRHFRLDLKKLEDLLPSLLKPHRLALEIATDQSAGNHHTITESTHKIIANSTTAAIKLEDPERKRRIEQRAAEYAKRWDRQYNDRTPNNAVEK